MAELPEQRAFGHGVARVEFLRLGFEHVVKEERAVLGAVGGRYFRIALAVDHPSGAHQAIGASLTRSRAMQAHW
jgi:hypothetical protein